MKTSLRLSGRTLGRVFLALALLLGGCAAGARRARLQYLTPAQIEFAAFPPAPALESETDKADLKELLDWQRKRTQAQCERARSEAEANFREFFGDGPFVKPLPPAAGEILKRIRNDVQAAVSAVKNRYKRPRPFLHDAELSPCLGRIGGYAYPSGHTAISRVYARLLSELSPASAEAFMARADEIALDRVLGGVHHPSDIEAGKRLGDELYAELRRRPSFQRDLETLRASLASPQDR